MDTKSVDALAQQLEPQVMALRELLRAYDMSVGDRIDTITQASSAVSLKRIADSMDVLANWAEQNWNK